MRKLATKLVRTHPKLSWFMANVTRITRITGFAKKKNALECEFFKESCLNTVTDEWRSIKGEHRKRWGRMTQITIYQFAKLDTYLFTDIIFFLCCMLVSNYITQCNFSSNLSKAVIILRIKVSYVSKKFTIILLKVIQVTTCTLERKINFN